VLCNLVHLAAYSLTTIVIKVIVIVVCPGVHPDLHGRLQAPLKVPVQGAHAGQPGREAPCACVCGNTARMPKHQLLVKHLATARTLAAGQHRRGEHAGERICKRASMSGAGAHLVLQALLIRPLAQPCLVTVHNT
jgi:hypothetical protein